MSDISRALDLAREVFAEAKKTRMTTEAKAALSRLPSADLIEVFDAVSPISGVNNSNNNAMPAPEAAAMGGMSRDELLGRMGSVPTAKIRSFLVREGILQE
jgi:hypothetical protein